MATVGEGEGKGNLQYSKKTVLASKFIEIVFWLASPILRFKPNSLDRLGDSPTIVLIEPFQLGDVLSLAVMIDPILTKYPKANIVVWCHTKNQHVLKDDLRVSQVIHAPFPWSGRGSKRGTWLEWKKVFKSCMEVRALKVDAAVDPRGDVRSQVALVLGKCSRRIGFKRYVHSNLVLRGLLLDFPLEDPPEIHRYRTNLDALSPLLGESPPLQLPAMSAPPSTIGKSERLILIHAGAGWIYKKWSPSNWASLLDRLVSIEGVHVCQIAGPGEIETAEEINRIAAKPVQILATSYQELLATISTASVFIGLDSGPMNAAALMNIPVIALFGPGDPKVWRPLSDRSRFVQHIENYPCYPCTQTTCVRPMDSCMTTISVDEVFEELLAILNTPVR